MNADLADDLDDMKPIVGVVSPKNLPKTTTVKQVSKKPPVDPKIRIGPGKPPPSTSNFSSLRKSQEDPLSNIRKETEKSKDVMK